MSDRTPSPQAPSLRLPIRPSGVTFVRPGERPTEEPSPPAPSYLAAAAKAPEAAAGEHVARLSEILPTENVREIMDPEALEQLAASVRARGVLQPVLVRPLPEALAALNPGRRYELVAGYRRYAASEMAGWDTIPIRVREMGDDERLELQAIENLQRENLTAIEEAKVYQRLADGGFTQAQIGAALGRSERTVRQRLSLLRLPPDVQARVGVTIDVLAAGEIARLPDPEAALKVALAVERRQLNWRQTKLQVDLAMAQQGGPKAAKDPQYLVVRRLPSEVRKLVTAAAKHAGVDVQVWALATLRTAAAEELEASP